MKTSFKWNKPIPAIAKEATGGKRTLLFMANEAKRLMNPYVPARNMVLSRNVCLRQFRPPGADLAVCFRLRYYYIYIILRCKGGPFS